MSTTPVQQASFEASQVGASLLALFVPYRETIGARTEAQGLNCARFYGLLVTAAGAEAAPWGLQYCAEGQLVFLTVSNVDAALSEIWGALSRADAEATCWLAIQQADGSWLDLLPARGAARVLPEEIILLPGEFYALEAELSQLRERSEALTDANRLGTITPEDFETQSAIFKERMEGVGESLAALKAKLCGGQS